jgi:hypothetical protein
MSQPIISPEERFAEIAEVLLESPGVSQSVKKGFGSFGLMIGGKLFAMHRNGELLLKLPKTRVNALVARGVGERFDWGQGRPMNEWVAVKSTGAADWLALASDAMNFVAAKL